MNALIRWSVRHRGIVTLLSIAWLIGGIAFAMNAPLDVFPEFVPPQVTIQTEAPGLAPEQVEQIVTRPIEAAVNGAPGIEFMRSESVYGLSVVLISFDEAADPNDTRQGISERLATLTGKLPQGVAQPKLTPLTSSTMDVLKLGLVSDRVDPYTLRDIADWTIKQRLLAVPGIARVTVYGGAIRQIQVEPNLDRLNALGLSLKDVETATREALTLRGGGIIETNAQRIIVETPPPEPDPRALAEAIVAIQSNNPIKLGDVASVRLGPATAVGDATIMGRPGVLVTISGQFGANTLEATKAVEEAISELTPPLVARGIEIYPTLHRPATFVVRALGNLEMALTLGSFLILIVLYAFLRSVRAALISFFAIPLSLLAAVIVLVYAGESINTMTLGGFALALGVLVDDAIIDIENIMRRLRLAGSAGTFDHLKVVEDASIEIRGSMFYGTLAVIFAFIPVLFAGGVQGRFIGPMALTFVLAVLASMLVALTVTPALCAFLLTGKEQHEEPRLLGNLKAVHVWIQNRVRSAWLAIVFLLSLASLAAASVIPFLYSELIPQFREGHFVVQMSMAASGTSVKDIVAIGQRITTELLKLPYIDTVGHQIGRAEAGEDTWSPDRSEFHIELKEDHTLTEEEAQNEIREVLEKFPEIGSETLTFLGDRISESLSGETAQVVVNALGPDLDALEKAASEIMETLASIDGIVDLRIPRTATVPTMSVTLDRAALTRYGLSPAEALNTLEMGFAGMTIGQTYAGARTVDVVLILNPDERNRLDAVNNLMVTSENGRSRLGNVATIKISQGRSNIQHEGAQRRVGVSFNGDGKRDLGDIVEEAKEKIQKLGLPKEVYISYSGQAEAERKGQLRLAVLTALSIALILAALALAFRRRALAALVLVNIPFCLIGSMAAIVFSGIGLTLGSLVGLVTVFGVGARNSVMMLAHIEHLVDEEGHAWTATTIRKAASERLIPVFMTALMAALGLVPLALGLGRPGHEIEAPMAITVLGGLLTATVLNLAILPEAVIRASKRLNLLRPSPNAASKTKVPA